MCIILFTNFYLVNRQHLKPINNKKEFLPILKENYISDEGWC